MVATSSGRTRLRRTLALAACIASVFALPTVAGAGGAGDSDGDGIADALDNCVLTANEAQRDSDRDGYGNRCDGDFDNDLVVGFDDLGVLKTAFFSAAEETDLDGDGFTGFADLAIFKELVFEPPGPGAPDVDGDGVALTGDRCPDSPAGSVAVADGCSALEMVRDPEPFIAGARSLGERILASAADTPELAETSLHLDAVQRLLAGGAEAIARGRLCEGTVTLFEAGSELAAARDGLLGLIAEHEHLLADRPVTQRDCLGASPPPECAIGADHSEGDDLLMVLSVVERDVHALSEAVGGAALQFETACEKLGDDVEQQAVVRDLDEHARRLILDDDTVALLPAGLDLPADVYPGREIMITGRRFVDNEAVLATGLYGLGQARPPLVDLAYSSCVQLRIAPIQRFAPFSAGPYVRHDPAAYQLDDGRVRVEHGMRLAAEETPFCGDSFGPYSTRYSLRLTLEFVNRNDDSTDTWVLATELDDYDHPVAIPSLVKAATDAQLTVEHRRQTCELIGLRAPTPPMSYWDCSEHETYATQTFTLRVYDRGGYCNLHYNETRFRLEDAPPTTFGRTWIDGKQTIFVEPDPGSLHVVAEGYEAYSESTSSYPELKTIDEGEPFGIFEHDCANDPTLLYVQETCGTTRPSGLRWPRLVGQRNGHEFWYSCRVPEVVRDLRTHCPQPPDSFYKLPFSGGYPVWLMGQGNNGSFTHNGSQKYAFDFVAPTDTLVKAARSGIVVFVREDQTGNSYYDPGCSNCMANAVAIRHPDGDLSEYFHFKTDGVFVTEGQHVKRGDNIGRVGNTGYSTDPHLHFQVRRATFSNTIPVRFEAHESPPVLCTIPAEGDTLVSDND